VNLVRSVSCCVDVNSPKKAGQGRRGSVRSVRGGSGAKFSEKLPDKWKPRGTCELFSTHGSLLSRGKWGERGRCVFLSAEGLNREPVVADAFVLSYTTANNALCKQMFCTDIRTFH